MVEVEVDRYELREVATETRPLVYDSEEDKEFSVEEAMVLILNKLDRE